MNIGHSSKIIIEITDTHIKFLQVSFSGAKLLVNNCKVVEIQRYSEAEIGRVIADSFASVKISSQNIITVIPRRFIIQRHIMLPSHDDQEIKKMVGLQISKQVPYPKDDIVVDYVVLVKDPLGYSKVLVVAVHKEVVGRYLKIFKEAGRNLNILTLSSEGLLNWLAYLEKKNKQKFSQTVAIINVDLLHSEVCFFNDQKLLFSRSVNFGARDLDHERIQAFMEQIHLTMDSFANEKITGEISQILLFSSLAQISILKSRLEADYRCPVDVVNPLKEIQPRKDLTLPVAMAQQGLSIAVAVGFGIASGKKFFNLLPQEVSVSRKLQQTRREWVKIAILAGSLVVLAGFTFFAQVHKRAQYLARLDELIGISEKKVAEVKLNSERLEALREKLAPKIPVVEIVTELYHLIPASISFRSISLDEKKALTLQGIAENNADINTMQKSLVDSPLFDNVNLQYATKRKMFRGTEVTDFKITCQISASSKK